MLHVMNARYVVRDLHTIAPRHLSVRAGDSSRRSEETVKNFELRLSVQLLLLLLYIYYIILYIILYYIILYYIILYYIILYYIILYYNLLLLLNASSLRNVYGSFPASNTHRK